MPDVKLLTLNLHCLVEEDLPTKQTQIANMIDKLDVDIVLFQEVAQSFTSPKVEDHLRYDNYALVVQRLLAKQNKQYYLYYKAFKESFGKYDEGLAVLSKWELTFDVAKCISNVHEYSDWHTRYVLTHHVTIGKTKLYIANTHFGWSDDTERFEDQFDRAKATLPDDSIGILAGDFNITPDSKEYHHVMTQGMIDLFDVEEFRNAPTHIDYIDVHKKGSRIDYVMSITPLEVTERQIVFDKRRVSDHYGLYLNVKVK